VKLAFAMPHLIELGGRTQAWELGVDGPAMTRLAKLADTWGYDMLSVPEHFLIPNAHVALSGPHHFHAYAGMGHMAGATETIRVNSSIAILPLQHPAITAKALSTIDWMSGGRITVTFAVGWLKEEFDLLGVPFHERGAMADEYLAAIIELWTSDAPAFEGKYVSFRDVAFEPKCHAPSPARPHLPIWMGGDADAALRRAARYASGWWPFLTKPQDIPARLDFIRSQADYNGRMDEVFYGFSTSEVGEGHVPKSDPAARAGHDLQRIVDRLGWFKDLGVTMSSVPTPPVADLSAATDFMQWVIEDVKPRLC
jgi:probable F420-dependent oxidoreductase